MDNMSNNTSTGSSWDLELSMGDQDFLFDHPPLELVPHMAAFHQAANHVHSPRLSLPSISSGAAGHPAMGVIQMEAMESGYYPEHSAAEEEAEEEKALGAKKEMMYKIAVMQPVDIDPSTIKKPKRRNVRISDDPQSVAARHRRERIRERIRILQRLVPGGTKMDTASMLDEAIRYVKFLKRQVQEFQNNPPQTPPQPQLPHVNPGLMLGGAHAAIAATAVGPILSEWPPQVSTATDHRIHGSSSSNSSTASSSAVGVAPLALGFGFDEPAAIHHQRLHYDFKRMMGDRSFDGGDASSSDSEDSGVGSGSSITPQKRKRGIVSMNKVTEARKSGTKIKVEFNDEGQPIGKNKSIFVDYIGVVARNHIPLTENDWRDTPEELKQRLWEDIEQCFQLCEGNRKLVYKKLGKAARDFRAKMSKRCYDFEGNPIMTPPAEYAHLGVVKDTWLGFVEAVGSGRFKQMSQSNSVNAQNKKYSHRSGALGYG